MIRKTERMGTALFIEPCNELKPYVAHYTLVDKVNEKPARDTLNLIPDASGCIIYEHNNEKEEWILWGSTTQVVTVDNDVDQVKRRFFIEFLPTGLYYVTHLDAEILLDKKEKLNTILPILASKFSAIDMNDANLETIILEVEKILLEEISKEERNDLCDQLIAKIKEHDGNLGVKEVSEQLYISERQLNRICKKYVGMSVKAFIKIHRINYILQRMSKDGVEIDIDTFGIYDQAHYYKIFKEICGVTPKNYLGNFSDFYYELYKFEK